MNTEQSTHPGMQIAVWGEIALIVPSDPKDPAMYTLYLKGKVYYILVMRAYVVKWKPEVGGYAVKYTDKTLGYLSKEEFEQLKQEGGHGI